MIRVPIPDGVGKQNIDVVFGANRLRIAYTVELGCGGGGFLLLLLLRVLTPPMGKGEGKRSHEDRD